MFSAFADSRKPRFRSEQDSFSALPYYRVMTEDGLVFTSGASWNNRSLSDTAKLFIFKACRKVGSSLKTCIRMLVCCIQLPSSAGSDQLSGMSCPSMDEIEHLLAELEAADLDSPGQDFSRASKTKGPEMRMLSPSIMLSKCATAPEIWLWAGGMSFRESFKSLKGAVIRNVQQKGDHIRQLAILNSAYRSRWYGVRLDMGYKYPAGATGKKLLQRKLPLGAKGLRKMGQWDIPADKDVYVPTNGVSRKLENRPEKGRWFYPHPSSLRQELRPE
ncbi:hypothetical protein IWZ01DRAFT_481732 [Phyllosticta capitalensis]